MSKIITGGGGGSGGGSGSTYTQDPVTLLSESYISVVDLLGEGEWEQIGVGGLQGIYLDDVPVQDASGELNFDNFYYDYRLGTIEQTKMGICDTAESVESVGVELSQNIPIERSITNPDADIARVSVNIPQLSYTDQEQNKMVGSTLEYKIEWKDSSSPTWNTVLEKSGGYLNDIIWQGTFPSTFSGYARYGVSYVITPGYTEYEESGDYTYIVKMYSTVYYDIQYKADSGDWISVKTGSVSGNRVTKTAQGRYVDGESVYAEFGVQTNASVVSVRILLTEPVYSGPPPTNPPEYIENYVAGIFIQGTGIQTVKGLCTSAYERQVSFRLSGEAPWTIRVTRLTEDSDSALLVNKCSWASLSTAIEQKLRYPGSAMVAMRIGAEQFSSIPARSYRCRMLKIKIPTNYDPSTRVYSGIWDGSFKVAWSDNPAWCFYDLITNNRYGLGDRIPESYVDKWALYEIAQYCDELVVNPDGSTEPRFTCNVIIQTREEAYKVVADMASIFRGMTYWGGGTIVATQDSPKDPSYAFNNSNVLDGNFEYTSSSLSTRYNAVSVTWNNPADFSNRWTEYVEDTESIAKLGYVNDTSIVAFGCASKWMARRCGKWLLYTNNLATEVVTFTTGMEGVVPAPGDVIKVSDTTRSQDRRGGRIHYSTGTGVKLDKVMTFISGTEYTISFMDVDGNLVDKVFYLSGDTDEIDFGESITVAENSIFIISDTNVEPQLFRVYSVSEKEQGTQYEVSALAHNPSKYNYIEKNEALVTTSISSGNTLAPSNITFTPVTYLDGVAYKRKLIVGWTMGKTAVSNTIKLKSWDGVDTETTQRSSTFEILDAQDGAYTVRTACLNAAGKRSYYVTQTYTLTSTTRLPANVTGLEASTMNTQVFLKWDLHSDVDVRNGGSIVIRYSEDTTAPSWGSSTLVTTVPGNSAQVFLPLKTGAYLAKAVNLAGQYSSDAAIDTLESTVVDDSVLITWITESPTFAGNKYNLQVVDDVLQIRDPSSVGTYYFSQTMDLGEVYTVNLRANIKCLAFDENTKIDDILEPIDTWDLFDGRLVDSFDTKLYVRWTNDDPNSASAVWTLWREFSISDYRARAFQFRLSMNIDWTGGSLYVSELGVSAYATGRTEGGSDIVVPVGGKDILYTNPFMYVPSITISVQDGQQGDYYNILNKTNHAYSIIFYNSSGVNVERTIDWISHGYGYGYIV